MLLDDADAVAETVSLVQVVGADKDGTPLAAQLLDKVAHHTGRLRVEGRSRFVQEQHRRLVEQRTGDGQLLPHPLGKAAHRFVPPLPQAKHGQVLFYLAVNVVHAVEFSKEAQVLLGIQARVEPRRLGKDAGTGAHCAVLHADLVAVDPGGAGRRRDERSQHPHRRRLARAIGPQEAKYLSLAHLQRQAIHGQGAIETSG